MTGNAKAYNSGNLNSDRIPGTERHLINLQYSNTDFLGHLVAQVYYRDETLTFYPFLRWRAKRRTITSAALALRSKNRFLRRQADVKQQACRCTDADLRHRRRA